MVLINVQPLLITVMLEDSPFSCVKTSVGHSIPVLV